jgi:hypothetical protein
VAGSVDKKWFSSLRTNKGHKTVIITPKCGIVVDENMKNKNINHRFPMSKPECRVRIENNYPVFM